MNTGTAILLVVAAGLAGVVIGRATKHCDAPAAKGWADVISGGFGLGQSLVSWAQHKDEDDDR